MGSRGPIPRNLATSPPAGTVPPPPRWMPPRAAATWRELAPALHAAGRLGPTTHELFGCYVTTVAELRRLSLELDEGPLVERSGHGPVVSGNLAAAIKLRALLGVLAGRLGIDVRGGVPVPPAVDQPPSLLEQWRRRHPA